MPLTWRPCWLAMASLSQVRGLQKMGRKSSNPVECISQRMDGCPKQPCSRLAAASAVLAGRVAPAGFGDNAAALRGGGGKKGAWAPGFLARAQPSA